MGRVHKKKIAEYAESAENENEQDEETKKSATMESNSDESEGEGTTGGAGEEGGAEDAKKKSIGSGSDEDQPLEEGSSGTAVNAKKANKRKAAPEKITDGDDDNVDSDDEPLNGGGSGGGSAKKGRKAAAGGAKKAAGKNGKTAGKRGKGKKPPSKAEEEDEEEEGEEVYEVKDIVGHKLEHGVTYYLIRWKGYTKDDDTWEPEDTLSCPDIIEKYNNKKSASKSNKKSGTAAKKAAVKAKGSSGVDPNKEWEVDKILDYAEEKNQRVFRIRWKGFGPKHDTWEPEENLSCDDIIDKFMKRMKSQENVSFKELREEPKKTKRLVNESLPRTNYSNPIGRKSKRAVSKKRVYYGDSDE